MNQWDGVALDYETDDLVVVTPKRRRFRQVLRSLWRFRP